jgi:hypothetical protein
MPDPFIDFDTGQYFGTPLICDPYALRDVPNVSIMEYPQIIGFTREELFTDPNFGLRPPQHIVSCFQFWLYFGLLNEVLRRGAGLEFEMNKFLG